MEKSLIKKVVLAIIIVLLLGFACVILIDGYVKKSENVLPIESPGAIIQYVETQETTLASIEEIIIETEATAIVQEKDDTQVKGRDELKIQKEEESSLINEINLFIEEKTTEIVTEIETTVIPSSEISTWAPAATTTTAPLVWTTVTTQSETEIVTESPSQTTVPEETQIETESEIEFEPEPETIIEPETTIETIVETEAPATTSPSQTETTSIPIYSTNGAVLDENIQVFLYQQLCARGIGYFMPYALGIAYQESRFNPYAQNPNGLDKGLFQFRISYYPGNNIFDPYEQSIIFCNLMANRLNNGCSIEVAISRHMMSDYGGYNASYVNLILSWVAVTVRIR